MRPVDLKLREEKQAYVEEINKHKQDINLRHICDLIHINYKQFLAGYNGDFRRISVKSLKKFVDAMYEELELQQKIKSFRIYKCYFDLQASINLANPDKQKIEEYVSRLDYLLLHDTTGLTKEEVSFLKREGQIAKNMMKKLNKRK